MITKQDVELGTLKNYLQNEGLKFNTLLIDLGTNEPIDIRYDNNNYQITIGDKEEVEARRKITSKQQIYTHIRDISNIAELLLRGAVTKKSNRSSLDTILLIDVSSTGNLNWSELEIETSRWASTNNSLCKVWKMIILVFSDKNIKLNWDSKTKTTD